MENVLNKTLTLFVIIGFMALTLFLIIQNATKVGASVSFESAGYMSTSTRTAVNGTALTNLTLLKKKESGTSCLLGSVVITGAAAGEINIYDATTTNSALRTKAATTTLVVIPASAAAGTYTFDLTCNYGLIYEMVGTAPTSTITWK